jgi:hypothetical protein
MLIALICVAAPAQAPTDLPAWWDLWPVGVWG